MSDRPARNRIRVLCVDDHLIVRDAMEYLIGREVDMELVGSVATAEKALVLFKRFKPDVTVMDLNLPGMSGLKAIRAIREATPAARVIVLTAHHGDEDVHSAFQAGAAAYILKGSLSYDLASVIREVHAGGHPMSPEVAALLAEHDVHSRLTPRETEILQLMTDGLRKARIAATLGISEETVHVHVRNIFGKLQVNDQVSAVTVALRRGIVHLK